METKKYKLRTDLTIEACARTLYRIEALKDFGEVKKGDLGGFVRSENNLSHKGDCWVYDDAIVTDTAIVRGSGKVYGQAVICDDALVKDNAVVKDKVEVGGSAIVFGTAVVSGDMRISGYAVVNSKSITCKYDEIVSTRDACLYTNKWLNGKFLAYFRSSGMWEMGHFYGTGEKLIAKAYKHSKASGREFERMVKYIEAMYNDLENDNK